MDQVNQSRSTSALALSIALLLAVVTSVLAGCGSSSSSNASVPPVAWRPCSGRAGPAGEDCATVRVPLDYAHTGGPKIGIAVARHRAEGNRMGSIVTNPGGPGESGIDSLDKVFVKTFSPAVKQHFDIVTFDPRGVARSSPVRCATGPQLDTYSNLDPAPRTDAGFQALVDATKNLDQGCQAMSGKIVPFVGTDNAARDMDEIRQALGDAKLTYVGFSYGTFLGATYAKLFPTHIRAMVLDGAENPALDPATFAVSQDVAFEKQLDAFFGFCAATPTCAWKPGGDLHAAYQALMARIASQPLPGVGARTLGPGDARTGVTAALYDQAAWPVLGIALQRASAGNGSVLVKLADLYNGRNPDGTYTNQSEAQAAISCMDNPGTKNLDTVRVDGAKAIQQAPDFGGYNELGCAFWPFRPTGHPQAITAAASPPIVVVGSTGDPATPYADAQALTGQLKHGVLVTRVGNGHTGYMFSQCVRDAVDAYLTARMVPAAGTSCPSS